MNKIITNYQKKKNLFSKTLSKTFRDNKRLLLK